jgi:ethanolamine utilization protein EutN
MGRYEVRGTRYEMRHEVRDTKTSERRGLPWFANAGHLSQMHLARVRGRVVATVKQSTLDAVTLQWIEPLDASGRVVGKPLVAVDRIGAGPGELVVYITSREAALTLDEPFAAVDAGIVAKVDWCDVGREKTLLE